MSFFTTENRRLADVIVARYPKRRSATIPLLHLAQEQHGWICDDAMIEIADLVDATPAEVKGTGTFYEMFKFHPVGKYVVNICGTMSCKLMGADELMNHAEQKLGVAVGETTEDGLFTLEHAECQAACTEAPTLQVNYRHEYRVTTDDFDRLVDDLTAGRRDGDIPAHGTLARIRQEIPANRAVGAVPPEEVDGPPAWLPQEGA
ncbi:MAG: NAD(P)H-dependent oxidoreductase subunit E [Actinomycetia bacterium]|nr:NAD(P)H-dependent oxidoreductase subunit E [Actinomycetes bacterium]MCP4962168.1 NAD(P)H-dependent oxidoreductase subunit E [Actinomycetes bacterium]